VDEHVWGFLTQALITSGVLGSAWLGNRVWKGKKSKTAEVAAEQETKPVAVAMGLNDPSTPTGFVVHQLDTRNRALEEQLTHARTQVVTYVENNARLKAEKTALEEDKMQLQRENLELRARLALRGEMA
jgi:small-conductance mechanosensitive channel